MSLLKKYTVIGYEVDYSNHLICHFTEHTTALSSAHAAKQFEYKAGKQGAWKRVYTVLNGWHDDAMIAEVVR